MLDDEDRDLTSAERERQRGDRCVRWGDGPEACIKPYDHIGPCMDVQGNTTLSLTAELRADLSNIKAGR